LNKNKEIIVRDLGNINYQECFEIQKDLQNEIIEIKLSNRKNKTNLKTPNYLLFVEHNHVYTLGSSGNKNHLLFSEDILNDKDISFHYTNRGGDITYHGPGQLVVYPILDLENFFTDIHKFLRLMEESVIKSLEQINIVSSRNTNKTGVWLDVGNNNERKICAMGVKVSRWVTMHGLALNVTNDLSYFNGIVPCGLENSKVTSVKNEIGNLIYSYDLKKILLNNFLRAFSASSIQ
jgi:lipoyl(octanoyl) transferase